MDKKIYLSPRHLLKYLCALDKNIGKKDKTIYHGFPFETPICSESITKEAKNMLEFVGLGYINPTCKFDETPENSAGYISDSRKFSNEIHITVSEKFRQHPEAIRAILAHEICHRIIYINGLDFTPECSDETEIMTDLCTIYIGFGKLIKEGYLGKSFELGYLEFPMYLHACNIMKSIGREYDFINASHVDNDIFLSETTEHWNENEDKSAFIRHIMLQEEKAMALEQRKIIAMINLLNQAYTKNADKIREISARLEGCGEMRKGGKVNLIQTFSALYEWHISNSKENGNEENTDESKSILSSMDACILDLIENNSNVDLDNLGYEVAKCPACGDEVIKRDWVGTAKLTRCDKCGTTYLSSHQPLNIIAMRRDRDAEKKRIATQKRDFETLRDTTETKLRKLKEEQESIIARRSEYVDEGYNKGYTRAVSAYHTMCAESFNALPKWLRWLMKKHNWPESLQ